ncbi:MAG: hypothetical protein ABIJ34_03230 [archaeon]
MAKTKQDIIDTLYKEIERKDKVIEKLKEENMILMKTAMKATERQKMAEEKLTKGLH